MTKVRGIPCQLQVCNEFSYLHLLEEGWFYTPEEVVEAEAKEKELKEKAQVVATEELEETVEEETVETEIEPPEPALTENEIRTAAKEAGIGHWHTKSINRLVSELGELEDGRSEN